MGDRRSGPQANAHEAFEKRHSRRIETLNLTVHEYEHRKTGAMHFHMEAPNAENVFMVAFRTVPMDSTGVAHILEHTALCGSEKYPVRDPFFWMIRRSLNTFMNAFTTNDYTAYPFASLNRKDYFNLMDVYLDSVFFSRLDELDFAQEGYRIEFDDPEDPASELVYRGVVYNEMKGDSSSPISVLFDAMNEALYPTTTYHFNSGGDPEAIPTLSYEELLAFYRTHYHPSNAIFMTFGDIPAEEQQAVIEQRALSRFERLPGRIEVGREQRFQSPRSVTRHYGVDAEADLERGTHVVAGWLLGDNTDLDLLLELNLLSDALLDTAASPLREALESSDLAGGLSPICGLEETSREMSFVCGVEGTEPEHAAAIERIMLDTLERVAREGIPVQQLEACLHQLELSQREIGGDGAPFGLQLMFSCMPAAIHRGDPIGLLDLDPALERLRERITDPDFIPSLIRTHLLDNPHRVLLTMAPDIGYANEMAARERQRLEDIRAHLSAQDSDNLVARARALAARQARIDDLSVLPRVRLEDVGKARAFVEPDREPLNGRLQVFEAGTNGLVYHQTSCRLTALDEPLLSVLPLYSNLVTEIGSGGEGYLETQRLQHGMTGGINAFGSFRAARHAPDEIEAWFTLSSRTLARKATSMTDLVKRTLDAPDLDERRRLRDLVRQLCLRRLGNITGNGHGLAMMAASGHFRPVPLLQFRLSGLAGIAALKALDATLDDDAAMSEFVDCLDALKDVLARAEKRLLLVADSLSADDVESHLRELWSAQLGSSSGGAFSAVDTAPVPSRQAWIVNTQVNFCAQAHPTVPEQDEDAAALSVLAGVLRNGFLHSELREKGGAYGGGATHDSGNGVFRFYSYRDPNLEKTFDVFGQAIDWIVDTDIGFDPIEESILGIVASVDAPSSPAGEAKQSFQNGLFGRDAAYRRQLRDRVLAVTIDDVKRVAQTYLRGDVSRAVVTNETTANSLDGFDVFRI